MAEDKKGFILYADQKELFDQLPNELAGELIKHIFKYVNDENPINENLIINLAFTSIKQQLKRDLKKYEHKKEEQSKAGIEGNLKRWNIDLYNDYKSNKITLGEALIIANNRKTSLPDKMVSGTIANIADKDIVNDTVKDIKNNIEQRKLKFASTLTPFKTKYSTEMLKEFYNYWIEPNKSNTKFRQELEKTWSLERRLETWSKNDSNFKKETKSNNGQKISL